MDIGQVSGRGPRDVTRLTVSSVGSIRDAAGPTGVVMMDESGAVDLVVADYLRSLAAFGATTATLRSYALALLRWWRFLDAVGIQWDQASAVDVRDFVLWMRSATGFGSPRELKAEPWLRPRHDQPQPRCARQLLRQRCSRAETGREPGTGG